MHYVRSFGDPSRLVLVDVYGSGRSPFAFFTQHVGALPFCYMLATGFGEHALYDKLVAHGRASALVAAGNACYLEALNYDSVGMLEDFTAAGPVRQPPGYDVSMLAPYHNAIACFIREAAHLPHRRPDPAALTTFMQRLLDETQRGVDLLRLIDGDWLWSPEDILKRRRATAGRTAEAAPAATTVEAPPPRTGAAQGQALPGLQ
jgi:hypothetical protein